MNIVKLQTEDESSKQPPSSPRKGKKEGKLYHEECLQELIFSTVSAIKISTSATK